MWVNRPLQVSQPGQLSLSSFSRSINWVDIRRMLRWRHLVNAYGVMAGSGWNDRLALFVLAAYARAKPCCFWLYLVCVHSTGLSALSCVSTVVMHIVAVCLRMNEVDYYYYYYNYYYCQIPLLADSYLLSLLTNSITCKFLENWFTARFLYLQISNFPMAHSWKCIWLWSV